MGSHFMHSFRCKWLIHACQIFNDAENKRSSIWQFAVTGGTVSCHYDNLRCHQWRHVVKLTTFCFPWTVRIKHVKFRIKRFGLKRHPRNTMTPLLSPLTMAWHALKGSRSRLAHCSSAAGMLVRSQMSVGSSTSTHWNRGIALTRRPVTVKSV